MKRIITLGWILLTAGCLSAMPVSEKSARTVAENFIRTQEKGNSTLTLIDVLTGPATKTTVEALPAIYVYNIGSEGFIIVSGDDEVTPVLGYSFNGVYNPSQLSPNFAGWLDAYRCDIAAIIETHIAGQKGYHSEKAAREWNALMTGDASIYPKSGRKSVSALLSSEWDQGAGYNNYCPAYSSGSGGHSYTGCVATAMAQIIRYWGYPTTGFGYSAYSHSVYGRLKVHHDSVVYDFNNMPDRVYPSSPQVQQDAVSLLCYHCGVSVSMNYQHAGNNDGSGAHTEDVPDALRHFGYMHAQMIYMTTVGESTWMQMLRDELDNGRPVLYRGISTGGGHAFVCDGYRDSQNKFHINWGWSGYQDGYFTLDNLNGYSTGQGGVINIYPSGLAPSQSTYYVSTDGTGDGSSWEMASSNLNDAIGLMKFRNEGSVWVKEGVYYGDTTGSVAFPLYSGVALYGGFVGNESFISDRTAGHPSILDGGNARVFFSTQGGGNKLINIDGFTLRHGRSDKVAIGRVSDNVKLFNCEITENVADDDGVILFISGHNIEYCRIHHNEAPSSQIIQMESGNMNCCRVENNTALAAIWSSGGSAGSCLIAHNSGDGADATLGGSFVNCDIVSNQGCGLLVSNKTKIRNCVVWNNDTAISGLDTNIYFSAIDDEGALVEGHSNMLLSSSCSGADAPRFTLCSASRGLTDEDYSYRLMDDSPLRDAADTNRGGVPRYDLDGMQRSRNGRVDIGCYEYMNVGIDNVPTLQTLSVYPNPATSWVRIEGAEGAVDVIDNRGRTVATLPEGATTLDVSHLPRGLYYLRYLNGKGILIVN